VALALIAVCAVMIAQVSIPDAGPTQERIITMTCSFAGANVGFPYVAGAVIFLKNRFCQE
jgi:hypothetical protein